MVLIKEEVNESSCNCDECGYEILDSSSTYCAVCYEKSLNETNDANDEIEELKSRIEELEEQLESKQQTEVKE